MKTNKKNTSRKTSTRRTRPLHRRILLHPLHILFLLAVGVILSLATFKSQAESLFITATVPAEPLTVAAFVTSPTDGQHVTTSEILVTGTCPMPSYVKLYTNDLFSGVAQCQAGLFHILTNLAVGPNKLAVRVFNITDSEGPQSPPITVYLDVPPSPSAGGPSPITSQPSGSAAGGGVNAGNGAPLQITADYHYQVCSLGRPCDVHASIAGGAPPYKITVDWGDGQISSFEQSGAGVFSATHTFTSANSFQPVIRIIDARGNTAMVQLLTIIIGITPPMDLLGWIGQYLWAAWPAYIIVLLMTLSFWLGEQEMVRKLISSRRARRRHA